MEAHGQARALHAEVPAFAGPPALRKASGGGQAFRDYSWFGFIVLLFFVIISAASMVPDFLKTYNSLESLILLRLLLDWGIYLICQKLSLLN